MEVKEASANYASLSELSVDAMSPAYKLTEAGVVPEDWEISTVGVEFFVQLGKMLDAEKNVGISKPFLGNRAVQWGRIDPTCIGQIKLTARDLQRYRLRDGDLLVCEGGEVGRAAIWRNELDECYYQKALHRLRSKRGYSPALMLNVLRKYAASGVLQNFVTQTSIAHLPKDKFEEIPIPLPGKVEQEAIADALSDADALIESLEQLIAKKRQIKQGTMQALLTGKQRLPGFSDEWKKITLGDLGSTYGGLTGKTKSDFGDGAGRYVTFMNVMSNVVIDPQAFERVKILPSESQNKVMRGDLLFNGSSETPEEVALCAVVTEETPNLFLNSFCFGFRFRDGAAADGLFMAYFLRGLAGRELMKSLAQGSTRYNLSKAALLSAPLRLPGISEQVAIATILTDMDTELAELETRLAKTRQLKQGMMQELLTGRIRLV